MIERRVVTSFLEYGGRILVLRRSQQVGSHRGLWAGVSGYLEEGATPLEQAEREIVEETGLGPQDVTLIRQASPLSAEDPENDTVWVVYPFLFRVRDPSRLRLDWEHTESRWIDPAEIAGLETVPKLRETWEQLWKRSRGG